MTADGEIDEARSEAQAILSLCDEDVARLFFEKTMRRNLTRTVRHLDRLVKIGGEDKTLANWLWSDLVSFRADKIG